MNSFDEFWELYDHKKSRDKCEGKWYLLPVKEQLKIMETLPAYIKSTPDRKYRKHPATYLNQRCWEDTIYQKEETKYIPINQSQNGNYKPEPFDNSLFILNLKEQIKDYFNGGDQITDIGGIVHDYLTSKELLSFSKERKEKIRQSVLNEKNRPRLRTEKEWTGSVGMEVKRREVQIFLKDCKEFGRDIILEL